MGYVLMSFREMFLVQKRNDLEAALQRVMQKKHDLHKYSSAIASDGIISLKEMATMPTSCLGLAMEYATFGHRNIFANSNERLGALLRANPNMVIDPNAYGINHQMAIEEARAEKERIKVLEDELDMEQKQLETQLSVTRQEEQQVAEGKKNDIQSSVAKYA